MGKKVLAIVIILIVLIGVGVVLGRKSNDNSNQTTTTTSTTSTNSNTQSNASQASSTGSIDIKNMMFTPSQITVAKGGTVTWINHDSVAHTVTEDNGSGPSSGNIQPGSSYSYTYNQTGSYQYHCNIHPSMRGTIVVK